MTRFRIVSSNTLYFQSVYRRGEKGGFFSHDTLGQGLLLSPSLKPDPSAHPRRFLGDLQEIFLWIKNNLEFDNNEKLAKLIEISALNSNLQQPLLTQKAMFPQCTITLLRSSL